MTDVGSNIPSFELPDADGKFVNISEFKGKNIVLIFYPAAFTGVCKTELCHFRDDLSKFSNMEAEVIGISVDYPFSVKEFSTTNNINFLLLCDYNKTVIKQFDIEFSDFFNLEGYTVAKRSVFIVDKAGIIQYKWIADDPGQEPDYAEIDSKISSMN
ncbi:MAG: redoxin domain-containing protein [Thaumarchaeota archaeon]|jgi:peroxiredoxin|nr:redoxin domain-containing protein [Nitrososphaerales archaeon]NSL73645.1 redoxin domain-containing protein [Nitrososphaerota archaeon]NSL74924.1 redoxin domain-containing protein [Nitrososphaerota archaeon]NSL75041.1 redoxin domain-containing protein [Nitrososphaerota archaeon]NSL77536.1 redoxin domain-containing protein [Nitrososphaerota archaeon]